MSHAPLEPGRDDALPLPPARAAHRTLRGPTTPPHVLVVSASPERRASLTRALTQDDVICGLAESQETALGMLGREDQGDETDPRFEVVVVDLPKCSPSALRFVRALGDRRVATVIVCPDVSFDEAVEAMRAGASDIVSNTIKPKELHRRVRSAVQQQRASRDDAAREDRLAGPVHRGDPMPVNHARPPKARKLADAPRASAPQPPAEIAEDFARLIRCELDVETLLRQSLEFVLAHAGPTNAAVFLPGTSGDFSLGAYVNYTCPKDTAEVLLDHLANVAAPRLEPVRGVQVWSDARLIREQIGEGADWLEDGHVLAFNCRNQGECLAVFMLFRERQTPFTPHMATTLGLMAEAFGQQLARVIRIHHRHLPREKWGALGDPLDESDEGGLAA